MASLLTPGVRRGGRPARRRRRAAGRASPPGTGARPRSTPAWSPPARSRPGPGIARIVGEALAAGLAAGRRLDLGGGVGPGHAGAGRRAPSRARAVSVFAGDIVPRKKPAPGHLPARPRPARAARRPSASSSRTRATACWPRPAAGLTCVITVNDFTADEDFSEAALVVSSLGDPGRRAHRPCSPTAAGAAPGRLDHAGGPGQRPAARAPQGQPVSACPTAEPRRRRGRRAHDRAGRGGQREVLRRPGRGGRRRRLRLLDGPRLRAGAAGLGRLRPHRHRHVPEEGRRRHHQPHRRHVGPDLGHGVPARGRDRRAPRPSWTPDQVVAMLRAAIEGIKARGRSDVGDKTLLDALVPAVDTIEAADRRGARRGRRRCGRRRPPRASGAEATRADAAPSAAGPATPASAASAPSTRAPSPSP